MTEIEFCSATIVVKQVYQNGIMEYIIPIGKILYVEIDKKGHIEINLVDDSVVVICDPASDTAIELRRAIDHYYMSRQ